jgi:hypothetical protein
MDAYGVAAGVSSENLWLGPGLRNAILLTNNAPGFPHAFLGTSQPADIGIGWLEVQALWGRLDRSAYAPVPAHPVFSALVLSFQPKWLPGLYIGGGRAFAETWSSLQSHHLVSILEPPLKRMVAGGDKPQDNQVASAWFRWARPDSGFELYGEYAYGDFPISVSGLLRAPDQTHGWVAGFQRLLRVLDQRVRIQFETMRMHEARPIASREKNTGLVPPWRWPRLDERRPTAGSRRRARQ